MLHNLTTITVVIYKINIIIFVATCAHTFTSGTDEYCLVDKLMKYTDAVSMCESLGYNIAELTDSTEMTTVASEVDTLSGLQ